MFRCAAFVILSLGWSASALAQGETRWSLYSPTDSREIIVAASICPLLDNEVTGNFFCISLACTATAALEWRVEFAGAGAIPDRLHAQFSVDNFNMSRIPMARIPDAGRMGYSAPFDAARDATTLAALARGTTGLISFDTSDLTGRTFQLAGAAQALQAALAQCPAALSAMPQTAPTGATTPRDAALAQIAGRCGVAAAQLSVVPGFETVADITGDGREDVILNYGAATCPGTAVNQYCGSGGCTHEIWAGQADGAFRRVFADTIFGMTAGWAPVLTIEAHGNACGRSGASGACMRRFLVAPDGALTLLD